MGLIQNFTLKKEYGAEHRLCQAGIYQEIMMKQQQVQKHLYILNIDR